MQSKKRAKGKARGAAKSRKKELRNDVKNNDVESQMQRLQISNSGNKSDQDDEDVLLEEAINLASAERKKLEEEAAAARNNNHDDNSSDVCCDHGFAPWPRGHVCAGFVRSFVREYTAGDKNSLKVDDAFKNALHATKNRGGVEVMKNPDMLQLITSYFLAEGTNMLLVGGKDDLARQSAMFANMFEFWRTILTCGTLQSRRHGKIEELSSDTCDEHTIVSFFKKRIPCKCLDKRHKEVKSIVKMGICSNKDCPLPERKAERSKLMHCERCRSVYYCSSECQKVAWPSHKKVCVVLGEAMSKLPQM